MQAHFNKHTPWRLVHGVIGGLIALKGVVFGTLALTLGVVVE